MSLETSGLSSIGHGGREDRWIDQGASKAKSSSPRRLLPEQFLDHALIRLPARRHLSNLVQLNRQQPHIRDLAVMIQYIAKGLSGGSACSDGNESD